MQENYSIYNIPSLNTNEVETSNSLKEAYAVYLELNQISEEIEKCRLRNI